MIPEVRDLLSISAYGGSSVLLAQGAGGNASVKSACGSEMWIKASGHRMSRLSEEHGYLRIGLPLLRKAREAIVSTTFESDDLFQERVQSAVMGGARHRPS